MENLSEKHIFPSLFEKIYIHIYIGLYLVATSRFDLQRPVHMHKGCSLWVTVLKELGDLKVILNATYQP